MTTQGTVISADGTKIAYSKYGAGPALILVGGAFQHRAFDPGTAELAERLGEHYTTYHYDRRGRGGSGDTAPYALAREIEDIVALIADAGGSAYLHGHSSGALLALAAADTGLPVPKMSVYEAPVSVDGSRPPAPADAAAQIEAAVDAGDRDRAVEVFLTKCVGVPAPFVDQMKQAPIWSGFTDVANTLAYDAELSGRFVAGVPFDASPWPNVTVPVLVLNGGAGDAWMAGGADVVAALLPDTIRDTVAGQDHGPAAEALAPVLVKFFG
jgi:pimeloyl-ACP methyl ester carboxylesterase